MRWNILVVDDEIVAVEGIKAAIDKEKFNIGVIYTAYNIQEAQNLLENNEIHILICDIEMPGGSGLELLEWVKAGGRNLVNLILTSHADFSYAQHAVSLGVMQYILKPASDIDLNQALQKAVQKLDGGYKENVQMLRLMREEFFQNILSGVLNAHLELTGKNSFERLCIKSSQEYILTLLCIERQGRDNAQNREAQWNPALFSVQNIAEEFLRAQNKNYVIVKSGETMLFLIIFAEEFDSSLLEEIVEGVGQYAELSLCCYFGRKVRVEGLLEEKDIILTAQRNNAVHKKGVFPAEVLLGKKLVYMEMDGELISVLLRRKKYDTVYDYMKHHLQDMLHADNMQEGIMKRFCEDAGQIFYQNFQDFADIFHKEEYLEKKAKALTGLEECLDWLKYALEEFRREQQERYEVSPVTSAMEYIEKHLDGELSCKAVAAYVGMHHDYLSRIMKKEKGLTLQQYIDEMRLKKAKSLLVSTDIPANTISQIIGYRHYTYFSTYFKKRTHMSPTDFRRLYGGSEEKEGGNEEV